MRAKGAKAKGDGAFACADFGAGWPRQQRQHGPMDRDSVPRDQIRPDCGADLPFALGPQSGWRTCMCHIVSNLATIDSRQPKPALPPFCRHPAAMDWNFADRRPESALVGLALVPASPGH